MKNFLQLSNGDWTERHVAEEGAAEDRQRLLAGSSAAAESVRKAEFAVRAKYERAQEDAKPAPAADEDGLPAPDDELLACW